MASPSASSSTRMGPPSSTSRSPYAGQSGYASMASAGYALQQDQHPPSKSATGGQSHQHRPVSAMPAPSSHRSQAQPPYVTQSEHRGGRGAPQQQQQQQYHSGTDYSSSSLAAYNQQSQASYNDRRASAHPTVPMTTTASAGLSPPPVPVDPSLANNAISQGIPVTSPAALQYFAAHPRRQQVHFGNYLLLQTLGEGEFGKVKLGVHKEYGEEVAVKLIKREKVGTPDGQLQYNGLSSKDPSKMNKVEKEIRVLRDVRHPNIVRLYEVIESDRYIGIVLEYASGGELFDHILAHKYLKERDACRLFAQLISGVSYLHQKKIVHRDLKLENLLLDRNRNVIITDFGFANNYENKRDDLMATSCGSPCYAAPELVVQDGLYAGPAVDVWSCGVILYAMLAGYLPFDDDPANPDGDNINLLYKYIMATPLSFPDYITAEPRDLLSRMLVPDPLQRADDHDVMSHSWLLPYRDLFKFTVEDLERAAMEQQSKKRQAYRQQMAMQQQMQDQQQQQSMARSQSTRNGSGVGAGGAAGTSSPATRAQKHQSAVVSGSATSPNIAASNTRSRPVTGMPMPVPAPVAPPAPLLTPVQQQQQQQQQQQYQYQSQSASQTNPTGGSRKRDSASAAASNTSSSSNKRAPASSSAASKTQRHTIQLEYDSPSSDRQAAHEAEVQRQQAQAPPLPKVSRSGSTTRDTRYSSSSSSVASQPQPQPQPQSSRVSSAATTTTTMAAAAAAPAQADESLTATDENVDRYIPAKPVVVPGAERRASAASGTATPASRQRSTSGSSNGAASSASNSAIVGAAHSQSHRIVSDGSGMPSPIVEQRSPVPGELSEILRDTDAAEHSAVPPLGTSSPRQPSTAPGSRSSEAARGASNPLPSPSQATQQQQQQQQQAYALSTDRAVSAGAGPPSDLFSPRGSGAGVGGGSSSSKGPGSANGQRVASDEPIKSTKTAESPQRTPSARHRKGLSTDRFSLSRLLGTPSSNLQSPMPQQSADLATSDVGSGAAPSSRPKTAGARGVGGAAIGSAGDENADPSSGSAAAAASTTATTTSSQSKEPSTPSSTSGNRKSSGGRRKAMSLVVGRLGDQGSPASRDREKAMANGVPPKTPKEEKRLTGRLRKDTLTSSSNSNSNSGARRDSETYNSKTASPSSQQQSTPRRSSVQPAMSPSPSMLTTNGSVRTKASNGTTATSRQQRPGTSTPSTMRRDSNHPIGDESMNGSVSTVGASSGAAKKVMDWFRKKSLSKGQYTDEQPPLGPFELPRQQQQQQQSPSHHAASSSGEGERRTPSVVVTSDPSEEPRTPVYDSRATRPLTTNAAATAAEVASSPNMESEPSSRSTSGTHSQASHATDSTSVTTATEASRELGSSTIQSPGSKSSASTVQHQATPRASGTLAQVPDRQQMTTARTAEAPPSPSTAAFSEASLRFHLGAVDQSALTSKPPPFVFDQVRHALFSMGIEVRQEKDEDFKLECVRRKRAKTLMGHTQGLGLSIRTSVFPPSQADFERSTAAAKSPSALSSSPPATGYGAGSTPTASAMSPSPSTGPGGSIRSFLRRGSSQQQNNVSSPGLGTADELPQPLYGENSVDGGQEVRFSVEVTKIKNLPGLYSLDIRRMKGNLWAYKFLYHALLERSLGHAAS